MATKTIKKPTVTKATTIELPTVRADTTTTDWATALLKAIGAPNTTNNQNNVKMWMASEEPSSSWLTYNNPLNTTLKTASSSTAPSGTAAYKTIADGVSATAQTLQSSDYTSIVNALRKNAPTSVFKAAVVQSPWASSHYSTKGTLNGANFSGTPLNAYATSTGGTPTGVIGGILNHVPGPTWEDPIPLPGLTNNPSVGSEVADVQNATSKVTGALSGLSKIESDLSSSAFWKRIGVGTLGVGLTITGVILFVVTSKTGEKTIGTAAKAV